MKKDVVPQGDHTELEASLLAELSAIERAMANLASERAALQRLLSRARQQRLGNLAITRRNSHVRILTENEIVEALRRADKNTLPTHELYRLAKMANPTLKSGTFRSHLHRLKLRGVITQKTKYRGHWTLPSALRT